MTAYPVLAARPVTRAGWPWLQAAVEMAALASGRWHTVSPAALGWTAFPRIATRTPAPGADAVAAAREFTAATLRRWGATERNGDVVVVMSEMLTNALRHALPCAGHAVHSGQAASRRAVRLGLLHAGTCVLCAVADPSDRVPVPRQAGELDECGRGLHVIDSLSDRWGCTTPNGTGKVVWAVFATAPGDWPG